MVLNDSPDLEGYELEDYAVHDRGIGDLEGSNSNEDRTYSSESETSDLFDIIDECGQKYGQESNFLENAHFQELFRRYMGQDKVDRRFWLILLSSILIIFTVVGFFSRNQTLKRGSDIIQLQDSTIRLNDFSYSKSNLTLDQLLEGRFWNFYADTSFLNSRQIPLAGEDEGYYLTRDATGKFIIKNIAREEESRVILDNKFMFNDEEYIIDHVFLNPSRPIDSEDANVLVVTNVVSHWRHSSTAFYFLCDLRDRYFYPVLGLKSTEESNLTSLRKFRYVAYSPDGQYLIASYEHDLYLMSVNSKDVILLTRTGSSDIFNGLSDWIYEEDVVNVDKLFWWSENSSDLIFVTINDTRVQEYDLEYFIHDPSELIPSMQGSSQAYPALNYPHSVKLNYPRPGTPIPAISLFHFDLKRSILKKLDFSRLNLESDFILYDASWMNNSTFYMKLADRTSRKSIECYFNTRDREVHEIMLTDAPEMYGGWIEKGEPIVSLPTMDNSVKYVKHAVHNFRDCLSMVDVHAGIERVIAQYDYSDLTSFHFNAYDQKIYCTFRNHTQTTNLVLLELNATNHVSAISEYQLDGVFVFSFTPSGKYVTIEYKGPGFPRKEVVSIENLAESFQTNFKDISKKLSLNQKDFPIGKDYERRLASFNLPTRIHKILKIIQEDGSKIYLNVIQILPPNFDPKKKHPLLVNVYGAPDSYTVTKEFAIGFEDIVSAELDAIVLIIDPRGTQGFGWEQKSYVKDKIGFWEPRDIVSVTSTFINSNLKSIDADRTAIWGWSYGGFSTLKTLEYDAGNIFKYGMAVAPVTNWKFYNSIYTERYMGSLSDNQNYNTYAQISEYNNFKSLKRFLLMHGTADDNVHIQNSLWLLDKFNLNSVENYDVHFFPDNDHSIYFHNSNKIVYDKLFHWLYDAFTGKFDSTI